MIKIHVSMIIKWGKYSFDSLQTKDAQDYEVGKDVMVMC